MKKNLKKTRKPRRQPEISAKEYFEQLREQEAADDAQRDAWQSFRAAQMR